MQQSSAKHQSRRVHNARKTEKWGKRKEINTHSTYNSWLGKRKHACKKQEYVKLLGRGENDRERLTKLIYGSARNHSGTNSKTPWLLHKLEGSSTCKATLDPAAKRLYRRGGPSTHITPPLASTADGENSWETLLKGG
jgi:hypothetical protein